MDYLGTPKTRLKTALNILVLSIALFGVSRKDFNVHETSMFEGFLIETFAPIQKGIGYLKHKFNFLIDHYLFMVNADIENQALNKKVQELQSVIYQLEELRRENRRLKDLLRFGEEVQREKVLAQIIGWDAGREFKVLRINKGSNDGIQLKSPVVTSQGLVGHIYRLSPNYSDILTVLDQNMRIDAIVDRTRSHGIVEGLSDNTCIMKYVTRTEPVKINDQVITSGLGNIYPKGLKVGHITKIEKESYGITQLIEVTPNVDFKKLEEVIVLISMDQGKPVEKLEGLDGELP